MSAGDHLSGLQFPRLFHGSIHDLQGDTLKPGHRLGMGIGTNFNARHGQDQKKFVSATTDEDKAWHFAHLASDHGFHRGGRTRVYEVEHNAQTAVGVENRAHPIYKKAIAEDWYRKPEDNDEHVAPEFKVKAQHDIRPGSQGTFPGVNWRKHQRAPQRGEYLDDPNHPYGHAPELKGHVAEAYLTQRNVKQDERAAKRAEPKQQGLF